MKKKSIGMISLGCDKNRVDSEKALAVLKDEFFIASDIDKADIVIINTCAFIEVARKEAIEEILTVSEYKKNGAVEKIIVCGCLPQRYIVELFDELKEVDAFLGISDYSLLPDIIKKIYNNERVNAVGFPKNENLNNRVLTTVNYAYLKIADGCSNHCTYCTIPLIRGKYRSVPIDNLVNEALNLGKIKELILVAQDVTAYGKDLEPESSLLKLIWRLSALPNIDGIRLLYCYPENITDELIHELAVNPKMIRYIDIPFQHADDRVLKLMGRKGTGESYLKLVEKIKREVNGIAIRSTFMTGFPQEDEAAFDNLIDFIGKAKLFNVGFFKYSKENGTPSFDLSGQVREIEKTKRIKKLYAVQKKIIREYGKNLKGSIFKVLAEGFDKDRLVYYGRAYFNAPDIDGKVYFFSDTEVRFGESVTVKIRGVLGYDFYGDRI